MAGGDVRWVRLDGLHLTLRFLGPTLEPRIEPAREAVRRGRAGQPRPSTWSSGPPARSRRVAGRGPCGSTSSKVRPTWPRWRRALDGALVDAGWPPETRPFKAHLTLARSDGVPAGRAIAQSLMDEAADLRIPARIDRIGLFESLTGGGPARYEPLEIVPLA